MGVRVIGIHKQEAVACKIAQHKRKHVLRDLRQTRIRPCYLRTNRQGDWLGGSIAMKR
jgi:hypothetical protein